MRINFHGRLTPDREIRAGFIGCGSHSFRNIYPTFQFAPVELVATCDLDLEKAKAFASKFGARRAYASHQEMLKDPDIEAVFIVTGYDPKGRPLYPDLAVDCLEAGKHVWMEKPPAATTAEVERMQRAAEKAGKNVMVGLKKMFFPANEQAKELACAPDFGKLNLLTLQYPQYVPEQREFDEYLSGKNVNRVISFLDHLCHPTALLVFLAGMPDTLYYERSTRGASTVLFSYSNGLLASLALTHGAAGGGGMERTMIVSDSNRHILVENNIRVSLHHDAVQGYGDVPTIFAGKPEETTAVWEPEFSLGQLYNKGLFLLGYYGEIMEFAS